MKRNRFMLIAGVMLAGIAFVAVLAFGGGSEPVTAPSNDVNVVIAAVDLSLGAELTADTLTTQTLPQADASGTYQRPEELLGQIVRRAVPAGQALTSADFDTSSQAQIAQSLQPGLRALALPLSSVDSVGALLQPGDRVDALISLRETDGLNPQVMPNPNFGHANADGTVDIDPYIPIDQFLNNTTVKVVVQNVLVLAVMPRSTDPNDAGSSNGQPQPDVVVVLAVSPQQSEVMRFAQLDGNVSLVLRSPGDSAVADTATTGITLKWLVDHYGVLPPQAVTP